MRGEIAKLVEQGKSRDDVYKYFMDQYGSQEPLASPIDRGFNRLAWAVPYAIGLIGLGLAATIAIRWSRARPDIRPAARSSASGPCRGSTPRVIRSS